jgi:hypothetical protein
MIVENFNAVEQTFCEAIAFAIGEHVDTSPRIIKARRQMESLKGNENTLRTDLFM